MDIHNIDRLILKTTIYTAYSIKNMQPIMKYIIL